MDEVLLSVNLIWVMLGTILVFFMHAGFAMVEAGFTRSKNAVNIIMKNFLTISLGGIVYFLCGYAIMFGDSVGGIFGTSGFALKGVDDLSFFIFQTMFAATGATILSGAVAERTNIFAYVGVIILMSLVVYPVVGHWVWSGQGWLTDLGFVDFAGSTVVHLTGAVAAFVAAVMVGPRLGKYENGRVNVITGHSIPLGALGVFLLWFGWFGFNGASTLAADPELVPSVIANTFFCSCSWCRCHCFLYKISIRTYRWLSYIKWCISWACRDYCWCSECQHFWLAYRWFNCCTFTCGRCTLPRVEAKS